MHLSVSSPKGGGGGGCRAKGGDFDIFPKNKILKSSTPGVFKTAERVCFSVVDIRSISEHLKISDGPVTIIQKPQKRRRVFIESDDEEYC